MRLIHLGNHDSTNIGNGALILGTERVLREDLGEHVSFAPEPWDEYTYSRGHKRFDASFVDLINETSDGLLVNGAVMFTGASKYENAGMRFNLPLELWPKIMKPIIFYGISYRFWHGQTFHYLDKLRQAIDYSLGCPRILFGVRNDGTKEWLESLLGVHSEKIISIPDPALYVPIQPGAYHPELEAGKVNLILSLNNEDAVHRFHAGHPSLRSRGRLWRRLPLLRSRRPMPVDRREQFLRDLARALEAFAGEHDLNIVVCVHSHEDYAITGDFVAVCPPRFQTRTVVSRGQLRIAQTAYFYDLYARADLAVGMRVHSMSPCVGLGTPLIALTSQKRMTCFMVDAGLEDFCVDILAPALGEVFLTRLKYLLDSRDSVQRRLHAATARMRERTRSFNRRIAELFN